MYRFAIIEDDSPTNDMFRGYLRALWSDCEVQQFYSFDTALSAIKAVEFDLVVSDLDLGAGTDKYGGIKIAKVIDSMKCPLLIVSGSPQPELHRDIFNALGAWDYLQKPVVEGDFSTQVRRAIYFRMGRSGDSHGAVANNQGKTLDPDLLINHRARQPVTWKGVAVRLTMTEVRIVEELVGKRSDPVVFDELYPLLNSGRNLANLRVHIQHIRDAFKDVDAGFDRVKPKPMVGYIWRG